MIAFVVAVTWSNRPVSASDVASTISGTPPAWGINSWKVVQVPGSAIASGVSSTADPSANVVVDHRARQAFVGAVRLYDRAAVLSLLAADAQQQSASDLELVARLYQRRGADALSGVTGDFSFVCWDWGCRRVQAARDHFGVRPLHYRLTPDGMLFAVDVRQLLASAPHDRSLDSEAVLDYLLSDYAHHGHTFFRSVRTVRPGHILTADAGANGERRYWRPSLQPLTGRFEDAAEEWGRLLRIAVRDRLAGEKTAAAYLSGGLDSGAVVGAAHAEWETAPTTMPRLLTLSAVFPDMDCDETPFILAARKKNAGFPWFEWDGTEVNASDLSEPVLVRPGLREGIAGSPRRELEALRARAIGVAISGTGGDELGWSHGVFRDLLGGGHLATTARQLLAMGTWRRAYRNVTANLRGVGRVRRRDTAPAWLGEQAASAFPGLADDRDVADGAFASHVQRETWRVVNLPQASWVIDGMVLTASDYGVELRMPFRDLRLVEFTLRLPWMHKLPKGDMRRFQRVAVAPFVAPAVAARRTKSLFSAALTHQIRVQLPRLREILSAPGWSSGAWIRRSGARAEMFRAALDDPGVRRLTNWSTVWKFAVFDTWHRFVNDYTPLTET